MKTKNMYSLLSILSVSIFLVSSCSKMNDLHDVYLKRGETIYVGQPDSAKAFPGNGRVLLRYWSSDPKATNLMVYWNFRLDSILLDIPAKFPTDSVDVLIPDLSEKKYLFELVAMNSKLENRSIPLKLTANVFGSKFQNSLFDRNFKFATYLSPQKVQIDWQGAVEKGIASELSYTNTDGNAVKMYIPMDQQVTVLDNFNGGLEYRTVFLPDKIAIDTFYTDIQKVISIDRELDKTKFTKWNPTGIPYYQYSATYTISNLWDNNTATWYMQTAPSLPHSFTFDLGQLKKITRIKQWQRLTAGFVYVSQNFKKFEIWGSDSPNVTADFAGWTKLGVYESIKPSGAGAVSPADVAYATAGEDFVLNPDAPPVRYIRYVVLVSWGTNTLSVSEVVFYERGI